MKGKNNIQSFGEFKENLNISDVSDSEKLIIELEKKYNRLVDELNKINKEAENGGDYNYLTNKYIWKMRILKDTEKRLSELLKVINF